MKTTFFIATLAICSISVFAQSNIGIGTVTPNTKAILDVSASDKGFLLPRLTSAERNAINPTGVADAALLVYDTDDNLFYYWNSTQWVPFPLATGSNNISLSFDANTGTLSLTDAGGTLTANIPPDNDSDPTNELQDLSLNNNQLAMSITNSAVDLSPYINTDNQTLSLAGNTLAISNGNSVDLLPYLDNTDNQTLSLTGNTLAISNGNNVDLTPFAGDWKLLGNASTNPTINFLGTTDNQSLVFRTNNTERVRILDNNGYVGIGTTVPALPLQVDFSVPNTGHIQPGNGVLRFRNNAASGPCPTSDNIWDFRVGNCGQLGLTTYSTNSSPNFNILNSANAIGTASAGAVVSFATLAPVNSLFLVPSGNVGIGTPSPAFKLDVQNGGINLDNETFSVFWGTTFSNAVTPSGHFIGRRARGTRANPEYVLNGDVLVAFQGRSFLMPNPGAWAGIGINAAEDHGPTNQGAEVNIATVPIGTINTITRVFIKENGRVGIGVPAPDQLLSVNGNASKPGGGNWVALSDARTKKNVQTFNDGLNIINQLRPVSYQYNEVSGYDKLEETYVGFIAQEVEKIAPYMVNTIDDTKGMSGLIDKKVLDDSALTKILVNAVKELSEKVSQLEKQNETLLKMNAELENVKSYLFQEANAIKSNN